MTLPVTRFNTFFKEHYKKSPSIDPVSKFFIIVEAIFGFNRIPVLGKAKVFTVIAVIHSIALGCFMAWSVDMYHVIFVFDAVRWRDCFALGLYYIKIVLMFVFCKQFDKIYQNLNKMDKMTKCTPKITTGIIRNSLTYTVIGLIMFCSYLLINYVLEPNLLVFSYLPPNVTHILDLNFFSHLFNLITAKVRFINYCLESSLKEIVMEKRVMLKEFNFSSNSSVDCVIGSDKLMDLYNVVIETHEHIINAIKWQIFITLISDFIILLWLQYVLVSQVISGNSTWESTLMGVTIWLTLMTPLFSPCLCVDNLQAEVRVLRKLIAAKLFENNMTKPERSTSRAFLALTNSKDLSFNLFQMIPVNISLPFSYIGLLLTYLIILLQFQKVITN